MSFKLQTAANAGENLFFSRKVKGIFVSDIFFRKALTIT